ncbi:hypothetical protein XELAEV_18039512mg [Xenopus laevis]|uniref:Uncharacterized protein n=1 Tax=Xenopus laevis TaxID=8355 RepID=A0A974C7P8_XENLA|nr:hypothetical protein XELAEV_18039512mg [Xenopus laevis]
MPATDLYGIAGGNLHPVGNSSWKSVGRERHVCSRHLRHPGPPCIPWLGPPFEIAEGSRNPAVRLSVKTEGWNSPAGLCPRRHLGAPCVSLLGPLCASMGT